MKVNGTYYSNDNRRLNVLRKYMHDLGREVYVQCRVFEWYHAYGRWLDRYRERKRDGLTDSHAIRLRDKRQLQPTAPAYPPPPHLRVTYLKKAMLQAANLQEPAVAEVGQGRKKQRSEPTALALRPPPHLWFAARIYARYSSDRASSQARRAF